LNGEEDFLAPTPGWMPTNLAEEGISMLRTILIVVLILMVLGALPAWPYSHSWGYYPSGGLGLLLIVLIVVMFFG
jgi:hypothetical protein